jgi:CRISPR/Cas system-associated protein Csm6
VNWDLLFKGLNAAALIASAALNVYLWFKSKTDERFKEIEKALGRHKDTADADRDHVRQCVTERKAHHAELAERVSLAEEKLRQLPTHDDLGEIHSKLADVGNRVAATDERSKILLDGMRRIESHLMDR